MGWLLMISKESLFLCAYRFPGRDPDVRLATNNLNESSHESLTACTFPAQATGIWAQLQRAKALVCEPHGTGEAFDGAMKTYYDAIAEGRGAIFFAICRGKVSPPEVSQPYTVPGFTV